MKIWAWHVGLMVLNQLWAALWKKILLVSQKATSGSYLRRNASSLMTRSDNKVQMFGIRFQEIYQVAE